MGCEDTRELLELYAVDALDARDREKVERHLSECAQCSLAVSELREMAELLPQTLAAAAPLTPPPHLKERLLSSLAAAQPSREGASDRQSAPKAIRPNRWRGWLRPRAVSAALGLLLLGVSIGWSVHLSVAIAQERALRAEFADLVGQQEVVLEIVDSRNTVKRALRSPVEGSSSYGKLFSRTDMTQIVSMAARLEPPPPGEAYHLWLTSDGQTRLAGTLNVNEEGFGLLVLDTGEVGPSYDSAQLTLQPEGAASPAGPNILYWQGTP